MNAFRLFLAVAVALIASSAVARTWTDNQGKKTDGSFVRYHNGDVVLSRHSKIIKLPLAQLSAEDQDYIRKELEKKGQADLLPPDPQEADIRLPEPGEERTWTSNDGKEIQARLVAISGKKATILFKGREVSVPLQRLSPSDQQYVKDQQRKQREPVMPSGGGQPALAGSPSPAQASPANPTPSQSPFSNPSASQSSPGFPKPNPMPQFGGPPPSAGPSYSGPPSTHRPPLRPNLRPESHPDLSKMAGLLPQTEENCDQKVCGQCNRDVPNNLTAGDKCPFCGVVFDYEEDAEGNIIKKTPSYEFQTRYAWLIGLGVMAISVAVRYLRNR